MMKRYMPVALAAILVLALAVPTAAGPFADVPENHWAYEAVKQLAAYGLIEGFPDGTFRGSEPMTRYQMAMVVARLLVSLDAQIKAEIEAAKAGVTPPPAPAPTEKIIEKETVTVEKPVIEKVIEQTIVEKLKTEELDALAARVAGVEGAIDAVSGKVDEVDKKAEEISAKVEQIDGALALLEGDFNVKALELETKAAAADADLAEKLAAIKAELEEKIAAGDNELSAKIEAKAKELITLIDALKAEFGLELTALGVRVVALEEQLALVNSKIDDMGAKLAAVDEKATAIGAKLDQHIAGHEKVTISGSSEVVLKDVDVYAEFEPTWNDDDDVWESKAWVDPNDIFDDEAHSDGSYVPTSTFQHVLDLKLTANVADGVVVNTSLATVKNLFAGTDVKNFELKGLSLEVKTPGVLTRLYAGGVLLPSGTFTPYTLTADQLKDSSGAAKYEGVVGQVAYGKFSGTTLFLRTKPPVLDNPTTTVTDQYAEYVCAGEGKVSLTDNLKLGVAYVSQYDDPQSIYIDHDDAFVPAPKKDTVISLAGSFGLAPGWNVSGEFAKNTKYEDDAQTQSGTAAKLDVTGKVGALELTANVTRVEDEDRFDPNLINKDPDDGGIRQNYKAVSISGKLPVGKLELSGGYKVEGDASGAKDWDNKKTNTATAGAKYEMLWGNLRVTPSVDLENKLYVVGAAAPYAENTNVFKLTGGVKGEYVAKFKTEEAEEVVPITAEYKVTSATKKVGGGAADKYYTKSVFDLDAKYALTENLTLTGGYNWTRMDTDIANADEAENYGVVESNVSVFEAGAEAAFPLTEATEVTASYNYALKKDLLHDYDPYKKSILKAGVKSQLTPKASVDVSAEFYRLDKWVDADDDPLVVVPKQYEYAPLSNLIAQLNYTYNIATNTTLTLGYRVVKSDADGENTSMDYTARIITGSLKVTF